LINVETIAQFKRLSDLNKNFGFLLNTEELLQDGTNVDDIKVNCLKIA
jgi:hypothetical protein